MNATSGGGGREAATRQLLDHVSAMVDYWSSVPGRSNVPAETSKREALEGLAFSLLVMLDGDALTGGTWELRPVLDRGDRIVILGNIAGTLHEQWKPNPAPPDGDIGEDDRP